MFLNVIFLLEKSHLTNCPICLGRISYGGKSGELSKVFWYDYVTKIKDGVFPLPLEVIPYPNTADLHFLLSILMYTYSIHRRNF